MASKAKKIAIVCGAFALALALPLGVSFLYSPAFLFVFTEFDESESRAKEKTDPLVDSARFLTDVSEDGTLGFDFGYDETKRTLPQYRDEDNSVLAVLKELDFHSEDALKDKSAMALRIFAEFKEDDTWCALTIFSDFSSGMISAGLGVAFSSPISERSYQFSSSKGQALYQTARLSAERFPYSGVSERKGVLRG